VWLLTQRKGLVASSGDVIILEEAAYVSSGFFYETVAPLLCIGMYMLHHCIASLRGPLGRWVGDTETLHFGREHMFYCNQHTHQRDELLHQADFENGPVDQQAGVQVHPDCFGMSSMHRRRKDTRMFAYAALDSAVARCRQTQAVEINHERPP